MAATRPNPLSYSPFDATLDGLPSDSTPSESKSQNTSAHRMALVSDSTPHLSAEMQLLLAVRLRAAALVLYFGGTLFWIWRLLIGNLGTLIHSYSFWLHSVLVIVLGACSFLLCTRCPTTLKRLRLWEAVIFGLPAVFFVTMQAARMQVCCQHSHSLELMATIEGFGTSWLLLMFCYSIFIPNTWQRVAVVAGAMAITPLVSTAVGYYTLPLVSKVVGPEIFVELALIMLVGWVMAVTGVRHIGMLRREAFEARRLGQYRLKERLGVGGMGEVYLAEHQLLKRPCAIKLIRPNQADDPKALARFEREVKAAARLSHWNSIEIFDYGSTADGIFYYVMEYLPGLNLASLVERFGPLPAERAVHLLSQTCDALCEAHAMGLVHRDIKPGNIFAAQRGGVHDVAKLLDFGLVKPLVDDADSQLTREGAITGSPLFMSPEQAVGESEPDPRGDIYSLGAVAYFLVTGQPPFAYDKALKVMFAHAHEEPVAPSQLQSSIPIDLERVILRCLAKKPDDRFKSAAELRRALDGCQLSARWTNDDAAQWWRASRQPVAEPAETQPMPAVVLG